MAEIRIIGDAQDLAVIAAALRHGLPAYGQNLRPPEEVAARKAQERRSHLYVVDPDPPDTLTAGGGRA